MARVKRMICSKRTTHILSIMYIIIPITGITDMISIISIQLV